MGKGSGSPPAAPDPVATAQAQTTSNIATARKTAELNRVNQVGPYGSITYTQGQPTTDVGAWTEQQVAAERARFEAANPGRTWDEGAHRRALAENAPGADNWTMTTTLSPEQQRLYDLTTGAQTTYGEIGNNQLRAVKDTLSAPDTVDYGAARDQALAAQRARLDPYYAQQEEGLRSRLLNQGLAEGTEGWNRAFQQFNQGRNDALLQADLQAGNTVGQQIQQTTALRARPLNEASVLLSGGQVQVPQLSQTPGTQVAPTDVISATNNAYQGNLAAWNAQNQSNNAATGGLFGLAGTLGGAALRAAPTSWWSDARLKRDITRLGTAPNGVPLYSFRYLWDDTMHVGVLAQDVLAIRPHAVTIEPNGYMSVDYREAFS